MPYNQQLLELIKISPHIVFFKDRRGRWLYANETFLKLFQLSEFDYQGKTDEELVHASKFYSEHYSAFMGSDEHVWNKAEPVNKEIALSIPSEEKKVFILIKTPIFQPDGSRKGIVAMGYDVTAGRRAEEKANQEKLAHRETFKLMEKKSQELEEVNTTLRVLIKQQKDNEAEIQHRIITQHKKIVFPYLDLLRSLLTDEKGIECIDMISRYLEAVNSPFAQKIGNPSLGLTRRESLVAYLIKQGKSTKEIAWLLGLEPSSVETYRNKIRKKLKINNHKIRLKTYLSDVFTD